MEIKRARSRSIERAAATLVLAWWKGAQHIHERSVFQPARWIMSYGKHVEKRSWESGFTDSTSFGFKKYVQLVNPPTARVYVRNVYSLIVEQWIGIAFQPLPPIRLPRAAGKCGLFVA